MPGVVVVFVDLSVVYLSHPLLNQFCICFKLLIIYVKVFKMDRMFKIGSFLYFLFVVFTYSHKIQVSWAISWPMFGFFISFQR